MGQHPPRWCHAVWPWRRCFYPAKVPEWVRRETLVNQPRGAQCRPRQHEELSVNHRWRWSACPLVDCKKKNWWQFFVFLIESAIFYCMAKVVCHFYFLYQLVNSHPFCLSFHAQYFSSFHIFMSPLGEENILSTHAWHKTVNISHSECSMQLIY